MVSYFPKVIVIACLVWLGFSSDYCTESSCLAEEENDVTNIQASMKFISAMDDGTITNNDDKHIYATCDPDYYAISCSVRYHHATKYPTLWGSWPSEDGQSCMCHKHDMQREKSNDNKNNDKDNSLIDDNTECIANCALKSIVSNYTIVAHAIIRGSPVFCPNGYQVTGCGYKDMIHSFEYWRDLYPKIIHSKNQNNDNNNNNNEDAQSMATATQEGCFCYSHYGASCYSICANNVINHSFLKDNGQPDSETKCPENSFALGCGIKSNMKQAVNHPASSFWFVDQSTCAAYDQYSVLSHAICGTFQI